MVQAKTPNSGTARSHHTRCAVLLLLSGTAIIRSYPRSGHILHALLVVPGVPDMVTLAGDVRPGPQIRGLRLDG